jgi:hypothetical protein
MRDREAAPARGRVVELDNDEDDELAAKRNKRRPNGAK